MNQNFMDNTEPKPSAPLSLNKHDAKKISRAAVYVMLSSLCGFLISLLPVLQVPPKYAAIMAGLIPMINIALVTAKKYFDDGSKIQ